MKRVVISGANRGLGLEFVRQYAANDWHVLAGCRRPDEANDLHQVKGKVTLFEMDVSREEGLHRMVEEIADDSLDLLINNAGQYGGNQTWDGVDYAEWGRLMQINCFSALRVTRAAFPALSRSSQPMIANISSKMGSMEDNSSGGSYIYRSTKAAMNAVTVSLARDLKSANIRVLALHPGWVRTDMGGQGAPLDSCDSVSGMRETLAKASMKQSGLFLDFRGNHVPW